MLPVHVAKFVYKNLQKGLFQDMFRDYEGEAEEKKQNSLYEVLQMYIQVYQNLEVRVIDMINGGRLNSQQALDIMTSYAIAEEGTNTLYLGLIDLISRRDAVHEPYTITEIEMLLNYFPHDVWQDVSQDHLSNVGHTSRDMASIRQKFYDPILHQLGLFWDVLTND